MARAEGVTTGGSDAGSEGSAGGSVGGEAGTSSSGAGGIKGVEAADGVRERSGKYGENDGGVAGQERGGARPSPPVPATAPPHCTTSWLFFCHWCYDFRWRRRRQQSRGE